jgi:hypothetical protein
MQSQLISGFRFLGLIADDGKPTGLHDVAVKDQGARKAALKKIIEQKYAALFALNLQKTTPSELAEAMTQSYNVTGDTREKAIRFFLAAVGYLGIPVSPLLSREKGARPTNGAIPRKRRSPRPKLVMSEQDIDDDAQPEDVEFYVIRLQSGGTLKLSASAKFFDLERRDRDFVFELLDKMREYEKDNPKP